MPSRLVLIGVCIYMCVCVCVCVCVYVCACANKCVGEFMVESGRAEGEGGREEEREMLMEKGP